MKPHCNGAALQWRSLLQESAAFMSLAIANIALAIGPVAPSRLRDAKRRRCARDAGTGYARERLVKRETFLLEIEGR